MRRDTSGLCHRSYGTIRVFFLTSGRGRSNGLFDRTFSVALCIRHLKGTPWLGSLSIAQYVRHLKGHLLWGLSLLVTCGCWLWGERENIMMVPSPACDSALLPCLAFLQRHFPLHLLPHAPLGHLPTVNSRLLLGIVLQYLYSSSQLPCIPRDFCPCPGHVGLWQGLSVWFLFRSDCHRSAATLSNGFKCFSTVPKASLVAQMLKNLPAVWETWV